MKRAWSAVVAAALVGCLNDAPSGANGRFSVTLRTADNAVDSQGWVEFRVVRDSSVGGAWQLTNVNGDGTLEGYVSGGTYHLNLHPHYMDHNLLMTGVVADGRFSGSWEFIGFAGPMKSGAFTGTTATR